MPSEDDEKMKRLRKLDKSVTRSGTAAALFSGLCGALIHGIGIAFVQDGATFISGSIIAIIGLALFLASYPIYGLAAKKQRRKVEAEILKLCKELVK